MYKRAGILLVLMFGTGCQQFKPMGDFAQRIMDLSTGRSPRTAAVRMEDRYFADERREGIVQLTDREFGRRPPYTDRYAQIASDDPDFLVRATAIRSLNRSRSTESTQAFVKALDDKSDVVRLEACKALVNMPDDKALPALSKIVANPQENKDTRIAAAEALKHYRNLESARALVAQLGGRDFGIAWQARRSLVTITGEDLRYDESAWLNYLTTKPLG